MLPAAMLILGLGGMAMNAVGQWRAGNNERRAGLAQARVAEQGAQLSEYNAAVAQLQAQDALERGEIEAGKFRSRVRGLIGEQRVGFAAGNIDVGFGSAVDVQADAAFLGELDALTIKTNAQREAWGFQVEAADLEKRADIMRMEGGNAILAGQQRQSAARWGAAGSVVSGTTSLLAQRYGFGGRTTRSSHSSNTGPLFSGSTSSQIASSATYGGITTGLG